MTSVKSKPGYTPLAADTGGRCHVLLGMAEGASCLTRVLRELRDAAPDAWQRSRVLFTPSSGPAGDAFRDIGFESAAPCENTAALLARARVLLDESTMGTRLYVAGPEHFIGRALQLAAEFNLNRDEIRAEHVGTAARRVHCVHCRADTEEVRSNIVRCAGCARWLQVRDHYSRRYAAYMGVMVDAEVPGALPPICESHP